MRGTGARNVRLLPVHHRWFDNRVSHGLICVVAHDEAMLHIREAETNDLPLLAGLEVSADRLLAKQLGPELFQEATAGQTRAADPGFLLVAGRPAMGFAQVLEQDQTAHLQQLVVDPTHGRQGVGTKLLEACCIEAARRGYRELSLTTFRDIPFNRPFYERCGFNVIAKPVGVVARHLDAERHYERLSPRVAMTRRLDR